MLAPYGADAVICIVIMEYFSYLKLPKDLPWKSTDFQLLSTDPQNKPLTSSRQRFQHLAACCSSATKVCNGLIAYHEHIHGTHMDPWLMSHDDSLDLPFLESCHCRCTWRTWHDCSPSGAAWCKRPSQRSITEPNHCPLDFNDFKWLQVTLICF